MVAMTAASWQFTMMAAVALCMEPLSFSGALLLPCLYTDVKIHLHACVCRVQLCWHKMLASFSDTRQQNRIRNQLSGSGQS